jgi:hypothetical protein
MHPSVRQHFVAFTDPLEGTIRCLYLDVKSLATTAIGNLVDTPAAAAACPFRRPDGTLATRDEIIAEWAKVKAGGCGSYPKCSWTDGRVCLAHKGWRAAALVTRLRLDDEGIAEVVGKKLDLHDRLLTQRFPAFRAWPADAQLATHSMAWACGAHFRFPRLEEALRHADFTEAVKHCQIAGGGTIRTRNAHNRLMYRNAAYVAGFGLDPAVLHWPRDIAADADDEEVTQPNLVPEVRPDPHGARIVTPFDIVRPKVPLGRPGLDDDDPDDAG